MYGNMNADILWLILLSQYLVKECDMTRIQADSFIFYQKDYGGKLNLMMSVHVDNVFMAGMPETLENIKEMIK